jgi:hypothetical protein
MGKFCLILTLSLFLIPNKVNGKPHSLHGIHNVSSLEFLQIANETISKVSSCVTDQWMYRDRGQKPVFHFPVDAQLHFEELFNKTAIFRTTRVHAYSGYEGPWLENIFINKFSHKPLYHFRGLIPLFLQFIDTEILHRLNDMVNVLSPLIRPDVLYLAISQGDAGLNKIGMLFPNILVMSAGGVGHIPLPLIKGELPFTPEPAKYDTDIGFYGANRPERRDLTRRAQEAAAQNKLTFKLSSGPNWVHDMSMTKFNLAPRGYGRTSFRFAESIQIGRIPVFLYSDLPWIPYQGHGATVTNISIEKYGFVANADQIPAVIETIKKLSVEEYNQKMEKLKLVRHYFTYQGVMEQIERFLHDPFGPHGGDLRCTAHPHTLFCCG